MRGEGNIAAAVVIVVIVIARTVGQVLDLVKDRLGKRLTRVLGKNLKGTG
jgi:hypothetical protein